MDLRVLSKEGYLFSILFFWLAGCESSKLSFSDECVEQVYLKAESLLREGNFEDASKKFKDIDMYFPYSEKASTSHIMSAYCDFQSGSYEDSVRELDIFLKYHPYHKMVPYALYLKAIGRSMMISKVGRDLTQAKEAKKIFIELINRFPSSKYAEDSKKRIVILDDIIAAHELVIGRYYQERKSYLAAINRYNYVVSEFSGTKSAEESFFRIIECCRNEGLVKEADNAASVLKTRFPNGKWMRKLNGLK